MHTSRADILLHPVRLRMIQAVESRKRLTAQQIGRLLRDIPQASLYRHLNRLVEGGFLHVVDERRVGGATERVYAVVDGASVISAKELEKASKSDHMRYFATFCAMLMNKFDLYLERDTIDLEADGVGYHVHSLHLSDDEFQRLIEEMNKPFREAMKNKPAPGRHCRLFATVVMPEDDEPDDAPPDAPNHREKS